MKIVYDSLTGNTRRFAERLARDTGLPVESVGAYQGGDALLLTYTFGRGEVPASTSSFLAQHAASIRGVVSSGSFHWGANFGRAGKLIAEQLGIPLVSIINKAGSQKDVEVIKTWIAGSN